MKPLTLLILLSIFVLSVASAAPLSYYDSAWFLDSEKTVRYCIDREPKFTLSTAEINASIRWALGKWVGYMNMQNLSSRPQAFQLAQNFQFVENCSGADLTFSFGMQNSQIDRYKAQDFFHPVSFARRTHYNSKAGWGQGLVWVDSDTQYIDPISKKNIISWKDSVKLKGILLHELGHVFGVGHFDGTIMRQNILESLIAEASAETYGLTHVTNLWELMSSPKNQWKTGDGNDELGRLDLVAFTKLIGRAPQGNIHAEWFSADKKIIIQDDLGQYPLHLQLQFETKNKIETGPLFYAYRQNKDFQDQWFNADREISIRMGSLQNISGEKILVIVEKNVGDRNVSILYQDTLGSGFRALFTRPCDMLDVPFRGPTCFPVYPKDEG